MLLSETKPGQMRVWERGIGVLFRYASTKTFFSVHTDNGCSQCHCEHVVCVVCLCLSVLEAPSVSLRHVRNAAGEVGDERKERGRKEQQDGIFRTRQSSATWLMWLCHFSLPAVHLKREGLFLVCFSLGDSLLSVSLSPGSGMWYDWPGWRKISWKSLCLPMQPLSSACTHTSKQIHTHAHRPRQFLCLCWGLTCVYVEVD